MQFNFYTPSNLLFGVGSLKQLPDSVKMFAGTKVLFITDPGIVKVGLAERALKLLEAAGIPYFLADNVEQDPSDELCEGIYERAKDQKCDVIVAMGGGSTIDAAKATNILFSNPGPLAQYEGPNNVKRHGIPLIAIPTTAGTGTETNSLAIISLKKEKRKTIFAGINNGPDCSIIDPELTLTLPPRLTAGPGMDALTHAMEAYLSKIATPITDGLALKGMELIYKSLPECVNNGSNLEARTNQMLGASMAGIAMANAFQGVCHATTAPIGAYFHVPHGDANAMCLPQAMKFNAPAAPERMVEMGVAMGMGQPGKLTADEVVEKIFQLSRDCNMPGLASYGVSIDKIDEKFITDVVTEFSAQFNPREIRREDVIPFVEACL